MNIRFFYAKLSQGHRAETRIVSWKAAKYQSLSNMFTNSTFIRVRYAETDQMSVVYYGNYAQYFEVGRVEALREVGITYKQLEEEGIMLPVVKLEVNYKASAKYDDLLKVVSSVKEMPSGKITFQHEVFNETDQLLITGQVILVFVNKDTRKPMRCPQKLLNLFEPYFTSEEV